MVALGLIYLFIFISLFLTVSGLRLCARAFSSCGKRGPLIIAVRGPLHHRGLSRCGAQAPDAQAQQPWPTGPAAPRHVGSSQTRARTRVPCISRQTPNHCAAREALENCLCLMFGQELALLERVCLFKHCSRHPQGHEVSSALSSYC